MQEINTYKASTSEAYSGLVEARLSGEVPDFAVWLTELVAQFALEIGGVDALLATSADSEQANAIRGWLKAAGVPNESVLFTAAA